MDKEILLHFHDGVSDPPHGVLVIWNQLGIDPGSSEIGWYMYVGEIRHEAPPRGPLSLMVMQEEIGAAIHRISEEHGFEPPIE